MVVNIKAVLNGKRLELECRRLHFDGSKIRRD